jgi:hypothetical protein
VSALIIIIINSTQRRVVAPLRDLVISLDLPVLQLRELINWQVTTLINLFDHLPGAACASYVVVVGQLVS